MAVRKHHENRVLPEFVYNSLVPTAIIVDIDGTLSDLDHRRPFDSSKVYEDKVRQHVVIAVKALLQSLGDDVTLFIFSGRDEICREDTVRWLKDKCRLIHKDVSNDELETLSSAEYSSLKYFDYQELCMRKHKDNRRDSEVKREFYEAHIAGKYNVLAVFDDRPQVIRELWKTLNLPVFNCGVIDVEF